MGFRHIFRLGLAAVPALFAAWSVAQAGELRPMPAKTNESLAAAGAEYRVDAIRRPMATSRFSLRGGNSRAESLRAVRPAGSGFGST